MLTGERIKSSVRIYAIFVFAGREIIKKGEGIFMGQKNYSMKILLIPRCSDYDAFRSLIHRLSCLVLKSPDISAPVYMLSQTTAKTFEWKHENVVT